MTEAGPNDDDAGPALVPLTEAARVLGIGRTTAYKLAKSGQLCPGLPVFRIAGLKVCRAQLDKIRTEGIAPSGRFGRAPGDPPDHGSRGVPKP